MTPITDPIVASLSGEEVLVSNPLAVVTNSWIVVRPAAGRGRTMIAIHRLTGVQRIRTTHPAFLVIAAGLFFIAAAAYYSKDGGGSAIPIAILGVLFVITYFGTRRASVLFTLGWERIETALGTSRQAVELVRAVRDAQTKL